MNPSVHGEEMHSRSASAPTVTERQNGDASLEVPTGSLPVGQLHAVLCGEAWARLDDALGGAARALAGRAVWMVNSTSVGGGVSELLRSRLPYWRAAGIDQHWAVVSADSAFFQVTKRIHNFLHGHPGDRDELGERERRVYDRALATNAAPLVRLLKPGDIVVLHDPQTAGLLPALRAHGAIVVRRSHVGAHCPNPLTAAAWAFLEPYLLEADAYGESSRPYVPPLLRHAPMAIIPPCIDSTSIKNRDLDPAQARAILAHASIAQPGGPAVQRIYHRHDGSRRLKQRATVRRLGNGPRISSDRMVVHLTRWDRLKDRIGVLDSFAGPVLDAVDAHLILAGPTVRAVADDPESEEVYDHVERRWEALPAKRRKRIELVRLPMADLDDNDAIVNALQSRANVVVKKSLEEGFGLGVTEAMWKRRAVVASAVGGHRDQIEHGVSGVLVNDPRDHARFGDAVATLLEDPAAHRGSATRRAGAYVSGTSSFATPPARRRFWPPSQKPRAAPNNASPDERERGRHPTGSARPAEQLARTGRVEDAVQLMNEFVEVANDVGHYTNEIEPTTGALWGDTPKHLGHLALISAALAHTEEMER
jgi:trehalose synthase